jgi:glycosyltransferase involved in cell wall biosynthesis
VSPGFPGLFVFAKLLERSSASYQHMPKISAIIHAENDERRLGRALESLRACDEVVVVDHASKDRTREVAREHGATIRIGVPGVEPGAYIIDLRYDWIFCLLPSEAVGESLEASLLEWKQQEHDADRGVGYCVAVREESDGGWRDLPSELRLANRKKINWTDQLPPNNSPGQKLAGELLRFSKP